MTEMANASALLRGHDDPYHLKDLRRYVVEDSVDDIIKTFLIIMYSAISVVGIFGNLLTILSILLNKKLRSIPNVYICNLAFADLIVCAVISTFSAYLLTVDPLRVSAITCQFIGALTTALLGKTLLGLTAIAVNRYILLVKGSQLYTRVYTRRSVIVSVITLWTMAAVLISPALLGFGQYGYNTKMGTCIFLAHDRMTYIFVQAILHGMIVGPCIIVTLYCYIRIIIYFRQTQHRLKMSRKNPKAIIPSPNASSKTNSSNGSHSSSEYTATTDNSTKVEDYELSSTGPSNNNSSGSPGHQQYHAAKRNRASRRVVANLCTVFIVFLLCWSPIVGIFTIDYYNKYPAAVYHIFFCIAVCNSCMNVFIYAGMNRAFRRTYTQLLTFQCHRINSAF